MKEYKFYLLHAFLQNFTQLAFFIFGSLLIYEKTHSIELTLLYSFLGQVSSVLIKSVFVGRYLRLVQRVGIVRVVAGTMLFGGICLTGLFFLNINGNSGIILLLLLGMVYGGINSCYWMLSNAFYFNYSGGSQTPGKFTSYNFIITLLAGTTVSLAALVLHLDHNFLLLFLLMGVFLLASIVPLKFLTPLPLQPVSFRKCLKTISKQAFWANVNSEHSFTTTAVPLIILFLFGSLGKSINISVIVALATMLLVYAAGKNKDKNSNVILWPSLFVVIILSIVYGFIQSPEAFVIVGIIYGLAYNMVDASRDACLSREVSNSQNPIQATVAVEFARSLGGLIGEGVLLSTYLIFHSLWQPVLALGVLFIIPKAFYALKNIAEMKPVLQKNYE